MPSPLLRLLRRAIGAPRKVEDLATQRGQTGPVARAAARVAAIVFPINASGNNRSMR